MSFLKLMSGPEGKAIDTANMLALITAVEAAAVAFGEIAFESVDGLAKDTENHQDRWRLLEAAKKLVEALEDPRKTALEIAKGPAAHAMFRTAFRLKLFDRVGENEVASVSTLAERTSSDEVLIARMMRNLVSIGIFREVEEEMYRHNKLSLAVKHPDFQTFLSGLSETTVHMANLPDFLSSIDYKNPDNRHSTLFQYVNGTKQSYFEWMEEHPEQHDRFSATMSAATELQKPTLESAILSLLHNDDRELGSHAEADSGVLIVDVGGGRGKFVSTIRNSWPALRGRIVVQDLPKEIEGREPAEGIEAMAYDFFTPQPIRGAQIYLFVHIFHDWSDECCRQILANNTLAMTPGVSKLVIIDVVIAGVGALPFTAMMDSSMILHGGMERTEKHWRALLEGAGLEVESIEGPKRGSVTGDSVIVAVKRDTGMAA